MFSTSGGWISNASKSRREGEKPTREWQKTASRKVQTFLCTVWSGCCSISVDSGCTWNQAVDVGPPKGCSVCKQLTHYNLGWANFTGYFSLIIAVYFQIWWTSFCKICITVHEENIFLWCSPSPWKTLVSSGR